MIDGDLRFGAFVPRVPEAYRDEAKDGSGSSSTDAPAEGGKPKRRRAQDEVEDALRASCKDNDDDDDGDGNSDIDDGCHCAIGPQWTPLKLLSIEPYNHDTSIFRFGLPRPDMRLNLPVTAHLLVRAPGREHADRGGGDAVRPYTSISPPEQSGSFDLIVKLYREWGIKESDQKSGKNRVFLYARTDHSYRPPGAVSNYVHSLRAGDTLEFKFVRPTCLGRIRYPFPDGATSITMIAVGAGVAPMIRILRRLLDGDGGGDDDDDDDGNATRGRVRKIRLLYGVRAVRDVLLREQLDSWHDAHSPRFQVRYCVGSRWSNVRFASKTKDAEGPPSPEGYDSLPSDRRARGWVDGEKVRTYGASSSSSSRDPGHRIFVCGLPGVYLSLAGPRSDPTLGRDSQLCELGYRDGQVVKF